MTQTPLLDRVLWKNRVADTLRVSFGRTASLSILGFVAKAINEKREKLANGEIKIGKASGERKDFLTRFIELQEKNSDIPSWQAQTNTIKGDMQYRLILVLGLQQHGPFRT